MGAKRALLVGCNYPGSDAALRGCVNDCMSVRALLTTYYGFSESDITLMIDTDPSYTKPTGKNIKAWPTNSRTPATAQWRAGPLWLTRVGHMHDDVAQVKLLELVDASKPGDVLVFHFSGHGTQVGTARRPLPSRTAFRPPPGAVAHCIELLAQMLAAPRPRAACRARQISR